MSHQKCCMYWLNRSCLEGLTTLHHSAFRQTWDYSTKCFKHTLWFHGFACLVNGILYLQGHCRSIRRGWRSWTSSTKRDSEMQASWAWCRERGRDRAYSACQHLERMIKVLVVLLLSVVWQRKNAGNKQSCKRSTWGYKNYFKVTCLDGLLVYG